MPHCVRIDELSVRCDDIGLDLLVGERFRLCRHPEFLNFFSLKALEDAGAHICAHRQSLFFFLPPSLSSLL